MAIEFPSCYLQCYKIHVCVAVVPGDKLAHILQVLMPDFPPLLILFSCQLSSTIIISKRAQYTRVILPFARFHLCLYPARSPQINGRRTHHWCRLMRSRHVFFCLRLATNEFFHNCCRLMKHSPSSNNTSSLTTEASLNHR
jgi:hypothetical protein